MEHETRPSTRTGDQDDGNQARVGRARNGRHLRSWSIGGDGAGVELERRKSARRSESLPRI